MKLKIIILMILMLISLNNISCETEFFEKTASQEYHIEYVANSGVGIVYLDRLCFNDISTMSGIYSITLKIKNNGWDGENSAWGDVEYHIDSPTGNLIGTGSFGYNNGTNYVFIIATIDSNNNFSDYTGQRKVYIVGGVDVPVQDGRYYPNDLDSSTPTKVYLCYGGTNSYAAGHYNDLGVSWTNVYTQYSFINSYTYYKDIFLNKLDIERIGNKSIWTVERGDNIIFKDFELNSTNQSVFDNDLNNNTWNVICNDSYGNTYTDVISFESIDDTPTLTTDKIIYNTSEQITISFTNLDNINPNDYVDLKSIIIMYPDINKYTGYSKKYIYNLLYHEYDGSFTINTSFLSPQTDYILFACDSYDGILFEGDSFNVYPDDEYLSISCDAKSNCISSNNGKNTFYYKINNNSDIIIKDNDNNIINTYYNIIGTGVITYTIPGDIEYLNTYPNWKVYLNNTDYSTSYNKNMEVYWSLFASPTLTPTPYPTATIDINISDQLDNLTVEIQPLKELLYGFVYIVIDNPDYDKDNIIDENEINHWFNSLIPMCLFLLLIILYIGLKKNRD